MTLAEIAVPPVGDGEVLVRVRACGICGSDVHGYDGSTGRRIPPLVMGHEGAGIVERVGPGVEDIAPGARVTFDSTVSCGRCGYCARGAVNLCDARTVLGVSCADYRRDGAFAEYVSVPARIVYRLPDSMPFEHAAMIEAVSVAVHAVDRRRPPPDDVVVVIGCGMMGLLVVQVLRDHGCRTIVAVDVDERRRVLARRFGATHDLDPRAGDVVEEVRGLTKGHGADHAFEVVGVGETVRAALGCVRKGGCVTLVGNLAPSVEWPLQTVVTRELTVLGSCASAGEYPACIEMMSRGRIDVAPLISATAPLAEGPAWFDRLHRGGGALMKVILRP